MAMLGIRLNGAQVTILASVTIFLLGGAFLIVGTATGYQRAAGDRETLRSTFAFQPSSSFPLPEETTFRPSSRPPPGATLQADIWPPSRLPLAKVSGMEQTNGLASGSEQALASDQPSNGLDVRVSVSDSATGGLLALASATSVTVGDLFFSPGTATIEVGETVTWNFVEGVHTATGTGSESWDSGILQGGVYSHTFNSAGTFPYICAVHPNDMTGTVVVASPGGPTPEPETDLVAIERAEFDADKSELRIRATSSDPSVTLAAAVTATGEFIAVLTNKGDGEFEAEIAWSVYPQNITVSSSLGGLATAAVELD